MKESKKYDTWEWDKEVLQENTDPGLWRDRDDNRLPSPNIEVQEEE